jgi:hypothetical protein
MPIPDQFTRIGDAMRRMNDVCVHFEVTSEDKEDDAEQYHWKVTGYDQTPEDRNFDRSNPINVEYVDDDDFRAR